MPMANIKEATVKAGGEHVRYLEAGAGWPVVLLHAFPLSADMWRPQLERVPQGHRFLAPDLMGFGPSVTRPAATLEDMAQQVFCWMDALALDDAVIGGLSMGGYVTLSMFELTPERFTGAILANTRAAADSAEGRAGREKMSEVVRTSGPRGVADQMLPKLLGATSQQSRPALAPMLRRLIEQNSGAGIDGAIHAMKDRPDRSGLLPRLGRPVLVVTADEDVLIPAAESEAMQAQLPRAQLVVLRRAGHLSNVEAPDEFSAALGDFLKSHF